MLVLVTGVAGFIGAHVARALLARGDRVIGIDNLSGGYVEFVDKRLIERIAERPLATGAATICR